MGIKYIHPIFVFHPPKENKKQKSQSQALFWKGPYTFFLSNVALAGALTFDYPELGKNSSNPSTSW